MQAKLAYLVFAAMLLGGVTVAIALETGPPAARTGAWEVGGKPAEYNCTSCHSFTTFNTGGQIQILDVPPLYAPGATYILRVRLTSTQTETDATRLWGFQFTAVRADNGEGAGTFSLIGADSDSLQVVAKVTDPDFGTRSYVEHRFAGTRPTLAGPVEWKFQWTAPDPAEDRIYFFAAGNAGNGDFTPVGDWIYTTADSTDEDPTPARAASWGDLKRRYR